MTRPRLQHYVTRAYLEGFLAKGERTLYVYMRDKTAFFRGRPEKIAAITNYYSQKREDGTYDDCIETAFSTQVEGPGIAALQRLKQGHYNLSGRCSTSSVLLDGNPGIPSPVDARDDRRRD